MSLDIIPALEIDVKITSFVIKFDKLEANRNISMRVKLEKDETRE